MGLLSERTLHTPDFLADSAVLSNPSHLHYAACNLQEQAVSPTSAAPLALSDMAHCIIMTPVQELTEALFECQLPHQNLLCAQKCQVARDSGLSFGYNFIKQSQVLLSHFIGDKHLMIQWSFTNRWHIKSNLVLNFNLLTDDFYSMQRKGT